MTYKEWTELCIQCIGKSRNDTLIEVINRGERTARKIAKAKEAGK